MEKVRRSLRRLRLFLGRGRAERAMDREIRQHLDEDIADRIARGTSPEAARRSALIDFGGVERIKEDARDARGTRAAEDLLVDLRYAMRILRRSPAFTAVAVLTFALGAGASTAIFSVVYGVLFRPLPYADPQKLVVLWERDVRRNRDQNVVSADNFEAWRDRSRSFSGMAALMPADATVTTGGNAERVAGAEVTPGYFTLLGVRPALGRDLTAADAVEGKTVLLGDGLWRRDFGADPAIVGQTVLMGPDRMTVAGVMPAGFDPPQFGWLGEQQMWFPMRLTAANRAWGRYLLVVARLEPGVGLSTARAEMTKIAADRAAESPADVGWSANVVGLADQISGDVETSLVAVLVGVGLLLVMAVTNVALLTLSGMQRRTRELAVRRALGATDARLFRQLFAQSALVGIAGAAAGLLFAIPGTRLLVALLPPDMPRTTAIAVDRPVLLVMLAATMIATMIFGTAAARRGRAASRVSPVGREGGDGRTTARTGGAALVTVEIALGLALSVMAVLMVQSFMSLRQVDIGFDADHVVAARVSAPAAKYSSPGSQRAFFAQVLDRIRAVPGVQAVGVMSGRPFGGIGPATRVHDARLPEDPAATPIVADVRYVDAALFHVLRIPIVAGRVFDGTGDAAGPPRVVISESLARAIWPDGQAIGRTLSTMMFNDVAPEVIGVVGDIHLVGARTPARPLAYLSAAQFPDTERDLIVRTSIDPATVVPALRAAVAGVEPGVPLFRVASMTDLVDRSLAPDRFTTFLLCLFAGAALLLAGIGIFGVFSTDVSRRRKELGLRLALGGSASSVMALLLRQALRRAALGAVAGIALALAAARTIGALLFGVTAYDPRSLLLVAAGIVLLTTAATLIPAAQALSASPIRALRDE